MATFGTWSLPFPTGLKLGGASLKQLNLTASYFFIGDQDIYDTKWYAPSCHDHATICPLAPPSLSGKKYRGPFFVPPVPCRAGECEIRLLMPADASAVDVAAALSGLAGALSSYYKGCGGTAPVYVMLLLTHLRPHPTVDGEHWCVRT